MADVLSTLDSLKAEIGAALSKLELKVVEKLSDNLKWMVGIVIPSVALAAVLTTTIVNRHTDRLVGDIKADVKSLREDLGQLPSSTSKLRETVAQLDEISRRLQREVEKGPHPSVERSSETEEQKPAQPPR